MLLGRDRECAAIDRLLSDGRLRELTEANARELVGDYSYPRAADAFARALEFARRA